MTLHGYCVFHLEISDVLNAKMIAWMAGKVLEKKYEIVILISFDMHILCAMKLILQMTMIHRVSNAKHENAHFGPDKHIFFILLGLHAIDSAHACNNEINASFTHVKYCNMCLVWSVHHV